jgi:hypothetical protein|tara:strand:- start:5837 stop:6076 length:240 start_codon:yes stop_codon:yes gene_type:complete
VFIRGLLHDVFPNAVRGYLPLVFNHPQSRFAQRVARHAPLFVQMRDADYFIAFPEDIPNALRFFELQLPIHAFAIPGVP